MWHSRAVRNSRAWGLHTPVAPQRSLPLLNQMRRDVWDYSPRRNSNPLTSCPLMRSLVSVGGSAKRLLNNRRPMARHGGRREEERRGGLGHKVRGEAWMTGCCGGGRRRQAKRPSGACLKWAWGSRWRTACVRVIERTQLSLKKGKERRKKEKELAQRGWEYGSCTARKISHGWECSHLTKLCVFHNQICVS